MVDLDAFLLGIKPALYGNSGSPTMMKNMDKLQDYPHVTECIDIFDGQDFFLFFQNEMLKIDFLKKSQQVVPRSAEFHELLGNTLGYPPLASRFYALCTENELLYEYSLAIRYAGIRCISHVKELVENANWIWNNYSEKEDMKILIDTTFYPVEKNDIVRLEELKQIKSLHKSVI